MGADDVPSAPGARPPGGVAATTSAQVATAARTADDLGTLAARSATCRACPRLVAWREAAAADPPARYRGQTYWARPVPGFGDPRARVVVVGLAPAAHGANRTGRMFTGDRSGDFLFAAMHRVGMASQPASTAADDGLTLHDVRVTAPVRCAPPANAPTPDERRTCGAWLARELELVAPRAAVVLGGFGWHALLTTLAEQGWAVPRPRPGFAHGAEVTLEHPAQRRELTLLGCYHVSQQNTFTGRLTPAMLDAVLTRAREVVGRPPGCPPGE